MCALTFRFNWASQGTIYFFAFLIIPTTRQLNNCVIANIIPFACFKTTEGFNKITYRKNNGKETYKKLKGKNQSNSGSSFVFFIKTIYILLKTARGGNEKPRCWVNFTRYMLRYPDSLRWPSENSLRPSSCDVHHSLTFLILLENYKAR